MMVKHLFVVLLFPILISAQTTPVQDVWKPVKFFVGKWEGTGRGQPGNSMIKRTYQFVLNGNFLQIGSKATYLPQEKNPKGEVHEDTGMMSYDRNRKQFVVRQFHIEGFVNQFVLTDLTEDGKTLVFLTETIENIPNGWRAKETYRILNDNEFVETFELAEPGKDFEVYSENRLKRKK